MRGFRVAAVAICAVVWMGGSAQAQSLRAISGPSELPPPGFTSGQFVDSRGCVFVRAGYGGKVAWVPRVGNNRKPLCSKPASPAVTVATAPSPTLQVAAPPVVAAPAEPAPAQPVRSAGAPMETVATLTTPPTIRAPTQRSAVPKESFLPARVNAPAPVVARPAAAQAAAAPGGRSVVRLVASAGKCPEAAAGLVRRLTDGRSVRHCGAAIDGTPVYLIVEPQRPAGAVQPVVAALALVEAPKVAAEVRVRAAVAAAPPVAASGAPACDGLSLINQLYLVNDGRLVVHCGKAGGKATYLVVGRTTPLGPAAAAIAVPQPLPKGYRLAWDDGRLSATRGGRTAEGQAAMQLVWTNDTPRRLIDKTSGKDVTLDFAYLEYPFTVDSRQGAGASGAGIRTVSSSSGLSGQAGGQVFVQVGSFGVPANAAGAATRLATAGLPVQVSKIRKGGRSLHIVLAGPFVRPNDVQMALEKARQAGFGDAFARN